MNLLDGWKTYGVSLIGAVVTSVAGVAGGNGMPGGIPPIWSFLITLGWVALACMRRAKSNEANKIVDAITSALPGGTPGMTNDQIKTMVKDAMGEVLEKTFPSTQPVNG